ncbi:hypothetical protein FBZ90_106176 [Nitrospirillum pindoramense]|uniref:Uncharacterized protein n=1 Tax=Nitrospirillum amazonense TaxID=28077 RepID=A0A560H8E6_9PROT|nr:hypothetical protein FBZ90_106176 [Nitrospirillum amazonense]
MNRHLVLWSLAATISFVLPRFAVGQTPGTVSAADTTVAECQHRGPDPEGNYPGLRPTETWWCPYGEAEARAKIVRFFDTKHQSLRIEDVKRDFRVSDAQTSFDDARQANYSILLSGNGGWRMYVWIRESFFPLNSGLAKFVPGRHPKRLDAFENSSRRIDISFKIPAQNGRTEADCERIFSYVSAAKQAGWTSPPILSLPTDGGRRHPYLISASGRHFSLIQPFGPECLAQISLWEDPRPQH